MATASARMTVGSLFATVGTAANALTSILDTGVQGIEMLDTYVKDMSTRQMLRSKVDMANFKAQLAEEKSQEMTERQIQVDAYCSKTQRHADLFNANYSKLTALLDANT